MTRYFGAIIERGGEGYFAFFPDVPGCTSAGETVQDALRNAEEALQGHLALALEHGEALPAATPLDQIGRDPEVDEAARALVRFVVPSRAVPAK